MLDHVLRGTPRAAVDHGVEGALVEGYVDGARGYVVHVADVHELPSDAGDVGVPLGHEVDDYLGEVDAELVRVPAFCEVPREGLVLNKPVSQRRMATSINHDAKQQDIHPSSSSSTSIPTLTSALGYELYDGRMGHRGGGKTHTVSRPEVENLGIRRRWARIEELGSRKGSSSAKVRNHSCVGAESSAVAYRSSQNSGCARRSMSWSLIILLALRGHSIGLSRGHGMRWC